MRGVGVPGLEGGPACPCARAPPPPSRVVARGRGCRCSACPRGPTFGAGVRLTAVGPPDLSSFPRPQGCFPWGATPVFPLPGRRGWGMLPLGPCPSGASAFR